MTFDISLLTRKPKNKPIIWTISGADCSGGAGIAADIKTGHNLDVEVCHLITANTVQNSTHLSAINATEVNILAEQAKVLRFDKPPAVIKIGLIANNEQIHWLVTMLTKLKQQLPNLLIVYDPVGQASVGGNLSTLTSATLVPLIPLLDVITPNFIEAKQLQPLSSNNTTSEVTTLAEHILQLGCKAVIIKGGHSDSETHSDTQTHCTDLCLQRISSSTSQLLMLQSPKINTSYNHGGGCSFASALSSFLAHGYLLRDSFTLTKAFINQGLALTAHDDSTGTSDNYYGAFEQASWPTKLNDFPKVISTLSQQYQSLPSFPSLNLADEEKLGLYPIVDSIEWLERLLPLNLNIIQLRIKNNNTKELAAIIKKSVAMARHYDCRLFINDHWQLAVKYGAYGVHIGQEDLASADLTTINNAGLRLGISTHGCYEFLLAKKLQPSYLAIGAIFPTKTKNMTGQIQGLANLTQLLSLASNMPVVAIGGINQQRLVQVWRTGVSAVAVVTAITQAKHPIVATQTMQALLR